MAAPRANWKGYLRLSLVSCPVAVYPATSESEKVRPGPFRVPGVIRAAPALFAILTLAAAFAASGPGFGQEWTSRDRDYPRAQGARARSALSDSELGFTSGLRRASPLSRSGGGEDGAGVQPGPAGSCD